MCIHLAGEGFPAHDTLLTGSQATNGYDGSMMNGLQTLYYWKDYFHNPGGSKLGILSAIMSLGSLAALPAVPYTADYLGRRMGVLIGCLIM